MDLESDISLVDEEVAQDITYSGDTEEIGKDFSARPELALLSKSIDLSKEKTKLARAGYLPQIALTGGAVFSNPSVYNGFERKFKGALTVGVMMRVPVLDWGETAYKIRASKNSTRMAELTYNEAEEMISLQVSQCSFKLKEAHKHLATALGDIRSAEENLRCANLGFKEGVISTTDVMAAQTAWMKAQTEKIDAEIDVKTAEVAMKKATGKL
jgi:outer membrane protein TolC